MPAETHSHHAPLGPDEVRGFVVDRIAELTGSEAEMVRDDLSMRDDLGIDDLLRIELAELIEQDLGERTVSVAFEDEALLELETVGDLVAMVCEQLAGAR